MVACTVRPGSGRAAGESPRIRTVRRAPRSRSNTRFAAQNLSFGAGQALTQFDAQGSHSTAPAAWPGRAPRECPRA
jgi:hypothetical protein